MSKIHVAVLRGGPSSEYDISLKSGNRVLSTLATHQSEKYKPIDIFISTDGTWHRDGAERSPDRALAGADVVWNALHGQYGEDGTVQKILDDLGLPYTGSGPLTSAMGMNKILAKEAFGKMGIKTPHYAIVRRDDDLREKYQFVFHHFLLPFIVKPAQAGSSAGLSLVKKYVDFYTALETAFAHGNVVVVEEYISGPEAVVGIVEDFRNSPLYFLPVVETTTAGQFCPGNFSYLQKSQLEKIAQQIHHTLGARHYSQTDFIVSPRRGIFALEINTLPALAEHTSLLKSLEAIGATPQDFFDHILTLAMARK